MPCTHKRQAILFTVLATMMNSAIAGVCIGHAPSTTQATVPSTTFTLAWMHSVEKIRWEADYRVQHGRLGLSNARVRGSGAGMEPPAGAVLRNGAWVYQPAHTDFPNSGSRARITPATTRFAGAGRCRDFTALIGPVARSGGAGETIEVFPCPSG